MASIGGAIFSQVGAFTTVANDTISMPLASTEVTYAVGTGIQKIELRNRNDKLLRLAFVSGDTTTTNYWTIYPGEVKILDNLAGNGLNIYLWCATASQTVEVIKYS